MQLETLENDGDITGITEDNGITEEAIKFQTTLSCEVAAIAFSAFKLLY